jgi:hypothetical protein
MGSVSHRLLVLLTRMPLLSISLHACSIQSMRSPRLLPSAMYAIFLRAEAGADLDPGHPQPLPQTVRVSSSITVRCCRDDTEKFRCSFGNIITDRAGEVFARRGTCRRDTTQLRRTEGGMNGKYFMAGKSSYRCCCKLE